MCAVSAGRQIGAMLENFNSIPLQRTFLLSSSDEKLLSFQGGRTILRQHRRLFEVLIEMFFFFI
jgi:hypothetical protein